MKTITCQHCGKQTKGYLPYSWTLVEKENGNQPHYNVGNIQPIDLVLELNLSFLEGCIVKYVCRYTRSDTPLVDLLDARNYLDMLIEKQRKHDVQRLEEFL